jgi:hypothetical protein
VYRGVLHRLGYRNGHVKIDASDWYYDARLRQRLAADPGFDPVRFRQPYVDHIADRAEFYDRLVRRAIGRTIPHTILIHYNLLNSPFRESCWTLWPCADGASCMRNTLIGTPYSQGNRRSLAGESLVWALAKETGRYDASCGIRAKTTCMRSRNWTLKL